MISDPDPLFLLMDRYWRAANYLSVGQIYLRDNAFLREPLQRMHVKPRLLGHWGTTPGLNFVYLHLNRIIRREDLDMILITGPGHGGPGLVANAYLEGTYTERYPNIERSANGVQRLFRQFSWPRGVPSHAAPETPGSIHEGGELGYSLAHAYGAAFDNPNLIVALRHRRWGSRNGTAGNELAFEQVSESSARWCSSAHPSFEWLQDRQSDCVGSNRKGRTHAVIVRLWLRALFRRRP